VKLWKLMVPLAVPIIFFIVYSNFVNRDDKKILFETYEEDCVKGQIASCMELASAYMNGTGTKRNVDEAVAIYERLCGRNAFEACAVLAGLYRNGHGVEKNVKKAAELYGRACKGGLRMSCHELKDLLDDM